MSSPVVRAVQDPALRASVRAARPLLHPHALDAALDLPMHGRALSGLARFHNSIVAIQDDTNSLLLLAPTGDVTGSIVLPAGVGGARQFDDIRGNKHHKHDFEACVTLPSADGDVLLAFGSGSTSWRERILRARVQHETIVCDIVPAHDFYSALRSRHGFAGSELNIEAAAWIGGTLRLFNRGNGAPSDTLLPLNATIDLQSGDLLRYLDSPAPGTAPRLEGVAVYDLGQIDGCVLSFTDAAALGDSIVFTAAAEKSPDATRDGEVVGSVVGVIRNGTARWTALLGIDGAPVTSKVEGILPGSTWNDRFLLVTDADDPAAASEIYDVMLHGPWGA